MRLTDCNFIGRITRVEYQRGSGSIILHGEPGETPIYLQPTDSYGSIGYQAVANFAIDLCDAVGRPSLGEQGDGTYRVERGA
jgi:hypothetical protein